MDILSVISEEVKELFSEVVDAESVSLETLESEVLEASREVGRRVLQACLSQRAAAVEACDGATCEVCGGGLRRHQRRQRYVETLCGVVRVRRWEYRCAAGHSHIPWDVVEDVSDGYTKGVRETMCRLSARLDYREAVVELKHQGIRVSHTTLQKQVQRWASGQSVSASVSPQSLSDGSRWYVSCDGVHANSPDGWKEVKVGCLYTDRAEQTPGSLCAAAPSSLRYVASLSDVQTFGEQWFALATASGIYQDETDTEEVVVLGDGAPWIWNLVEEYFPGATEIIDYMHAKTHLYSVAKQVYGEEETAREQRDSWVAATETFLYAGDIQEVVARIRAIRIGLPESVSERLEKEANYFLKHAKRMRYKYFQENGYHIGSGVIESACKHVVAERCKQAGMRWTPDGINAILFYRCLLKNGTWETFWKTQGSQAAA